MSVGGTCETVSCHVCRWNMWDSVVSCLSVEHVRQCRVMSVGGTCETVSCHVCVGGTCETVSCHVCQWNMWDSVVSCHVCQWNMWHSVVSCLSMEHVTVSCHVAGTTWCWSAGSLCLKTDPPSSTSWTSCRCLRTVVASMTATSPPNLPQVTTCPVITCCRDFLFDFYHSVVVYSWCCTALAW